MEDNKPSYYISFILSPKVSKTLLYKNIEQEPQANLR